LLLMRARYATYLPRIRHRGRIAPLFPTYLFVRLVAGDRWYPIAWTPHVTRLLMAGDRPAQLAEDVVNDLRKRERDGLVRLPRQFRLRKGQQVRIIGGSFEGAIALYDGQSSRDRERVLLELLGRKVSVELPARDLAPLANHNGLCRYDP
jgi:transcription antitermination factor NusG